MAHDHGYDDQPTRMTFIARLKDEAENAWDQFYDEYASMILSFARKCGCSDALAEDVLQETVMSLLRVMPEFEYNPEKGGFRSLLFKISESKVIDAFRRTGKTVLIDNHELFEKHVPGKGNSPDDTGAVKMWDEAWDNHLLAEAVKIVREKVQPLTYKCFERVYLQNTPVKTVAEELYISPNLVSQHKHKVYNMIVETAQELRKKYGE